jgi:Uma2 family endonuclease
VGEIEMASASAYAAECMKIPGKDATRWLKAIGSLPKRGEVCHFSNMGHPAFNLRGNPVEAELAFQATPAELVAEMVDGELPVHPRPSPRHARASSRLGAMLSGFDLGSDDLGGWLILDEPELHLGARPDKLVPDLAGWRRERMPELPDTAAIALTPDWLCEVLSESTAALDRGRKRRIYAREGVRHLWFVDPEQQLLEVFRLDDGYWLLVDTFEASATIRAEPFEAIELELGRLWER